MNRAVRHLSLRFFLLFLLCGSLPVVAQEQTDPLLEYLTTTTASNRVTVAFLPLENSTHDAALAHWRFAGSSVLGRYLAEAKGLRLLPQSSLSYGLAHLGKKAGDHISTNEAVKLGELIEARRVLWGSYTREAAKWCVNVQILNVSGGTVSKTFTARSDDWFAIRDELGKQILKELRVTPSKLEHQKMTPRWTKSPATVEWLARARMAVEDHHPATEWGEYAKRAAAADPHCAEAMVAWASTELSQGKSEAGLPRIRKAIEMKPDYAAAHALLGHALMLDDKTTEAEHHLSQAALLDSDDPVRLGRLAEYYLITKQVPDAVDWFNRAIKLGPFQSSIHANLGRALLMQGQRDAALAEMKEAERLDFEPDLNTEEYLAWGYAHLNESPAAIAHYEKAVAFSRQVGLNPKRTTELEREMNDLKASLTPSYITARPPHDFTSESLTEALRTRLTVDEASVVICPLTSTPEIEQRARDLTRSATNNLHKAKLLFEALTGHLNVGEGALRTAPQAFEAWNGTNTAFRCQEYALLYVMLARAAGLRAYFTDVSRAYDDESVFHACAAVFDGEKALLIDPSYRWFGVPHKAFRVMDDLQTTGEYLSQIRDTSARRIAAKLQPESAYTQFNLAFNLVANEKWDEARQQLPVIAPLDSTGALTNTVLALLSYHDKKFEDAVAFGRKAQELGFPPHNIILHMILGNSYYELGRFSESRECLRKALRCSPDEKQARHARHGIAKINELIGSD